jgi:DNA repair and recombination protein RAD54B
MMKSIVARRWQSDLYVGDEALVLLGELRKVCGHPALLEEAGAGNGTNAGTSDGTEGAAANDTTSTSGKMEATLSLLDRIINGMGERVVVVSQWTSMLDVLEKAIKRQGFTTARLDGSTPVAKRQDVVDAFNKNNIGQVFLLSTQAGGVGLNLIGANRLVLYDSHWNPALDAQAMARIWRDGQQKPCYIYRMITAGSVEEKIYQRQMMKGQLARCCVGMAEAGDDVDARSGKGKGKKEGGSFTKEELKELFNIKVGVSCMTADQLRSSNRAYVDDLEANDSVLRAVRGASETISFVFNERAQEQSEKAEDGGEAEDGGKAEKDVPAAAAEGLFTSDDELAVADF